MCAGACGLRLVFRWGVAKWRARGCSGQGSRLVAPLNPLLPFVSQFRCGLNSCVFRATFLNHSLRAFKTLWAQSVNAEG